MAPRARAALAVAVGALATLVAAQAPVPMPTPPSLLLWLRPEELVAPGGACGPANVTLWPNAAPNASSFLFGYDAAPPVTFAPPARYVDPVTGRCVARFAAARRTLLDVATLDLQTGSPSYTVTVIARMWWNPGSSSLNQIITGAYGAPWVLGWDSTWATLASSNGVALGGVGGGHVAWPTSEWVMFTLTRDAAAGGASTLYRYGNAVLSGSLPSGPSGIRLGGAQQSDCDVAEVVVHGAVLSTPERVVMEGALARKYGFTQRLPAAHPHFALLTPESPPTVALPTPLAWLRPEALPAAGDVAVWNSTGSAASVASTFAGSGGSAAPALSRAQFANGTAASVARFTASRCTRHVMLSADLSTAASSHTVLLVSRMWGDGNRGRTLSSRPSTSTDWMLGSWNGRISTFHTNPITWVYSGTSALTQYGSNAWQLYAVRRQSPALGNTTTFYRNGVELASVASSTALGPNGFYMGGGANCGEPSDVDVAELLVYDYALTDAQLVAATAYVMGRYALDANNPVTSTALPSPTTSASATSSFATSPTASVTATATVNRCAVDESFADGAVPSSWVAQPSDRVSVVTSAPPRGVNGATVYDPLSTGSPFAYLTTGAEIGAYSTLSLTIPAQFSRVRVTADVQFDAGSELPFNDAAFVTVTPSDTASEGRQRVCGVTERAGGYVSLVCPSGSAVSGVRFASFGTPMLSGCADGEFDYGSCHNNATAAIVAAACVGQSACSVPYSAAAVPCGASFAVPLSLAAVVDCAASAPIGTVWSSNVSSVGAYAQSGWQRVTATTATAGSARVTFGLRAAGAASLGRVSALAVDNVLVCLLPAVDPLASPSPVATSTASPVPTPVSSVVDSAHIPFVSGGGRHTCGVTPLNRLLCWGSNVLYWGDQRVLNQATVPAELVFANVSTVAAGIGHTCAVLADGRVRCFGGNWGGQCDVPTSLYDGSTPALAVSAGHDFSCALTRTGGVICWGSNADGRASPPQLLSRGAIALHSLSYSSCAISAYRTAVCWGLIPQPPAELLGVRALSIAQWSSPGACAVTLSRVVCWGGAFSTPTAFEDVITSVAHLEGGFPVLLSSRGVVFSYNDAIFATRRAALVCGELHCCSQSATDGTLACTGDTRAGQLTPPLLQPFATPLPRSYPADLRVDTPPTALCDSSLGRSATAPAVDCADYLVRSCNTTEGLAWIRPGAAGLAYQAWCDDGFALAMRLSGAGTVFNFSSRYWTDDALPNTSATSAFQQPDARLRPFVDYPATMLRVRNRAARSSVGLAIPNSTSLSALFRKLNGATTALSAPRSSWLSIAPGACLQTSCNSQALNHNHFGVLGRIGIFFNEQNDCNSPDTRLFIGSSAGYNVDISCASPDLEIYVRGSLPYALGDLAVASTSPSLSATPTVGVPASVTASVDSSASGTASATASRSVSPTRSGSPPLSGSPTGTLTRAASASATATTSWTPSATATPPVSPYCAESEYAYYPGYDVDHNAPLGASLVASERDCARACCDVPRCDAYAYAAGLRPDAAAVNCYFAGNVTGIGRNNFMAAGLRRRVLS
jgi:hypothetical protein